MKTVLSAVEKAMSGVLNENVQVLSSSGIGGGCINHASKLKTNAGVFFLKWNADCAADLFVREAEGIQELAKAAENKVEIPKVICFKEVNETPGFLVLEYLSTGYLAKNADEKLGQGLAHIHQYKNSNFGFYNNNYCGATPQLNTWNTGWPAFFRDQRLGFLLQLIEQKQGLSMAEKATYEKLLDRLPRLLPADSSPALIHGDLWSGNYMTTDKGPALIDPAASYAHREMEFGIITMFGGFSQRFFDAYNEINPLEGDWHERNRLYQLYHILNHYYLFGGSYGAQALAVAKSYL
ncbi:MAG: fructosamine kinase family protein [Draconibacterium sp.]